MRDYVPHLFYLQSHPHWHPQEPNLNLGQEILGFFLILETRLALPWFRMSPSYPPWLSLNRTASSLGQGLPCPARSPLGPETQSLSPWIRKPLLAGYTIVTACLSAWASQQCSFPSSLLLGLTQLMGYAPALFGLASHPPFCPEPQSCLQLPCWIPLFCSAGFPCSCLSPTPIIPTHLSGSFTAHSQKQWVGLQLVILHRASETPIALPLKKFFTSFFSPKLL